MKITISTQSPIELDSAWLVVPIFDAETAPPAALVGTPVGETLTRLLEAKLLPGGLGESTPILGATGLGVEAIVTVGLGKRAGFGAGHAHAAGVAVSKKLARDSRGPIALLLPESDHPARTLEALVGGIVVGQVGPDIRKAERSRKPFEALAILAPGGDRDTLEDATRRGTIIGEAVNLARDLVNTPPAEKSPAVLADRACREAEAEGLKTEVWDEARLRNERFGGLLGVAAGSDNPPRFVILEHRRGGDAPTLALIGKGVTFDSGGLSLKPSTSMEDMKSDMSGAATVLATMVALGRLGAEVNVVGYLAITENMTGGRAMKLGDVLTMRNGKTVEVLNTDAEGRLILADALSYAAESKPSRILDLATLTGACLVALGTRIAGLFSTDDGFADELLTSAKAAGERAWRLPLDDDFNDGLKSTVADLKNIGGRWGGAITAAKFLENFVAETPWLHLDIAGPAWSDADSATRDAGGSGCFVRTLVEFLHPRGRTEKRPT